MRCPKCGGFARVVDSRGKSATGKPYKYIHRRRRCEECRLKFSTYEMYYKNDVEQETIDIIASAKNMLSKSIDELGGVLERLEAKADDGN